MIIDLIAAHQNEGLSWEILRRFMPRSAARELDMICSQFGPKLYREIIWDEREKGRTLDIKRRLLGWPIKRVSNVIPFRRYTPEDDMAHMTGFWSL